MIWTILNILLIPVAYWFTALVLLAFGTRLDFGCIPRSQWFKRFFRFIVTAYVFPPLIFTVTGFLLTGRMAVLITGRDRGFETKFPFTGEPKPMIEDIWE